MKSTKLLWVFMVGDTVVIVLTIIGIIWGAIGKHIFGYVFLSLYYHALILLFRPVLSGIEVVILVIGWIIAFNMRGKTFQWGFINLGGKEEDRKPDAPLASIV